MYLHHKKVTSGRKMEIEKINDGRDTLMGQRLNMRGSVTQKETVSGEEEKQVKSYFDGKKKR